MSTADRLLLVFRVAEQSYALALDAVLRVLPMMEVAELPAAPGAVSGVIDVAGRVVPVMGLRRRFGLPARESQLGDVLILATANGITVALPADGVEGVVVQPHDRVTPTASIAAGIEHVEGVAALADGLVLIHDLERFLFAPEQAQLAQALRGRREQA